MPRDRPKIARDVHDEPRHPSGRIHAGHQTGWLGLYEVVVGGLLECASHPHPTRSAQRSLDWSSAADDVGRFCPASRIPRHRNRVAWSSRQGRPCTFQDRIVRPHSSRYSRRTGYQAPAPNSNTSRGFVTGFDPLARIPNRPPQNFASGARSNRNLNFRPSSRESSPSAAWSEL
jgi:hypothetical protein